MHDKWWWIRNGDEWWWMMHDDAWWGIVIRTYVRRWCMLMNDDRWWWVMMNDESWWIMNNARTYVRTYVRMMNDERMMMNSDGWCMVNGATWDSNTWKCSDPTPEVALDWTSGLAAWLSRGVRGENSTNRKQLETGPKGPLTQDPPSWQLIGRIQQTESNWTSDQDPPSWHSSRWIGPPGWLAT